MYKFLIVDDEALEAEALRRTVLGRYGERCAVQTAASGKQAVERAEAFCPDIVLMDIEMPGINGLEAAQIIRQSQPRTRVIIVTAYERFLYAQMALALGAEEYLLKPVNSASLLDLLDRTLAQIDADRQDQARRAALDELVREQFLLSAISGQAGEAALARQYAGLGLPPFAAGLIATVRGGDGESAERIAAAIRPGLDALAGMTTLAMEGDGRVTVLLLAADEAALAPEAIEGPLRGLAEAVQEAGGPRLHIGAGPAATVLDALRASHDLSIQLAARCTAEAPLHIARPDEAPAQGRGGLADRLYRHLLEKDLEAAVRCTDTMVESLRYVLPTSAAVREALCELLAEVAARLDADVRAEGMPVDIPGGEEIASLSQQAFAVRVRALLAAWIAAAGEQPPARMHHIRAEIERYLQAHFSEDLSVRQVAQEMHYSEPYFSKLFTRCFQRSFVSYLTDLRMQAARDMLGKTAQSVREVGTAVGFSDANYFAKVFRKAYGVTPSEWRRFAAPHGEDVGP